MGRTRGAVYQSMICDAFAGCTSIMSWAAHSADGGMYVGRNEDWSKTSAKLPQVLSVRRPTDGSYNYATMKWPGIVFPLKALKARGAYMDRHDGTSMAGAVVCYDPMLTGLRLPAC